MKYFSGTGWGLCCMQMSASICLSHGLFLFSSSFCSFLSASPFSSFSAPHLVPLLSQFCCITLPMGINFPPSFLLVSRVPFLPSCILVLLFGLDLTFKPSKLSVSRMAASQTWLFSTVIFLTFLSRVVLWSRLYSVLRSSFLHSLVINITCISYCSSPF